MANKIVASADNRYLQGFWENDVVIHLNYGWCVCSDPSGRGEVHAYAEGKGNKWQAVDIERPVRDGGSVHWYRRVFYLPDVHLPRYKWQINVVRGKVNIYLNAQPLDFKNTNWLPSMDGGKPNIYLNGQPLEGNSETLLHPGEENIILIRVEGSDAFFRLPVSLTILRRVNANNGFLQMSNRFYAIPPHPVPTVTFKITNRIIQMRQGSMQIPLMRKGVRSIHYLSYVNPETPDTCTSFYGAVFEDGSKENTFIYHGEQIASPYVPRTLPFADCHLIQTQMPGCEIDTFIGVYDFVWDNVRPQMTINHLIIDKYLSSQSSVKTIIAITLETDKGFEPLNLNDYYNAEHEFPIEKGLVNLGFIPRKNRILVADGIPFITAECQNIVRYKGGTAELPGGFTAEKIYLLGAIADGTSNGGSFDPRWNVFFGDQIGTIRVCYTDRTKDEFPVILGVNCMPGSEWNDCSPDRNNEPFFTNVIAWKSLDKMRAWRKVDGRGYIALKIKHKRVSKIIFKRNPLFTAIPVFGAITVEGEVDKGLLPLPFSTARDSVSDSTINVLTPMDLTGEELFKRVGPLQRALYRCDDDLPDKPELCRPVDYKGPNVIFYGKSRWATMLSNTFVYALRDTVAKLISGPDTSASSTPKAPCYGVHGTWRLGVGRGNNENFDFYWPRDHGRTAIERYEMGLAHLSPNEIEYTDRAGRIIPFPPHQTQETANPRTFNVWYSTTVTGQRVYGNPENDGHGLVMIQRYVHWLHSGQNQDWLKKYWKGTEESAEWICWQLDNPFYPTPEQVKKSGTWNQRKLGLRQPENVLWTSSECSGYRDYEIYSTSCCLAGLRGAIRMAKSAGREKFATRWQKYANLLIEGIERHLVTDSPYGPIWRYSPLSSWHALCEALGPLLLVPDIDSYDTPAVLPKRWLEISQNTFNFFCGRMPDRIAPGHFGYGFGFFLQSALLLDRMKDASRILENILRFNYDGRLEPWIIAESIVVSNDRSLWYRWGDHGNSVQQGEILKGIRLIIGVDDLDPMHTRLMPRMPDFCDSMNVKDYPVMLRNRDSTVECKVDFNLTRQYGGWNMDVEFTEIPERLSVRLGPFTGSGDGQVEINGIKANGEWVVSDDSRWVWIEVPKETRLMKILSKSVKK